MADSEENGLAMVSWVMFVWVEVKTKMLRDLLH